MLADCATFQTECGAINQAGALTSIHLHTTLTEYHRAPRATIFYEDWSLIDRGKHNWREEAIALRLTIELLRTRPADDATALQTQEQEVLLKFGNIIDELRALSGTETGTPDTGVSHLNVTGFKMVPPGLWMEAAEESDQRDKTETQILWWMAFLITCN